MQDWVAFAHRYKIFLRFLDFQQRVLPTSLAFSLAARSAEYFSPHRKLQTVISGGMRNALDLPESELATLWQRYLRHTGTADLITFLYKRMTPDWVGRYIHINSDFDVDACLHSGRGLFLMTYHNHYPLFLTAITGLMGYKTYMVAMDFKGAPLYPHMPYFAEKYYIDSAKLFKGGRYLFITDNVLPVRHVRTLHKALSNGHIVVSANDFPSPFPSKRNMDIEIFGRRYACPVGSLQVALKEKAMLAVGWARATGQGQFQVDIHALQGDTLEEVMADYLRQLHNMIKIDPALWEGWKWLPE